MYCPDCGGRLSNEAWGEALCLKCLLHLAAPTPHSESEAATEIPLDGSAEAPTLAPSGDAAPGDAAGYEATVAPAAERVEVGTAFSFSAGEVLGDRYRVLKQLGRGGMGEVWRAYDLKLRMDVALKTLLATLAGGERGLELLRSEVRAAREVISPNVCRLFDIIEIDGQELVSMEYIDGHTLKGLLEERGPLEIQEAGEIGSQFLAGLEAIHQAGLVHRDIKPENIMITRSGRVVIMDFGLTAPSGSGALAGTPAYMPPEQGRGEGTDARADVFSAGMVLAEMLSALRGPEESSRQTFWENVRREPPELPDTPWTRILLPAVAADREGRYESAAALARKLEEVAFRVEGAEDKTPYPGLESYSEDAAEFFFGREAEVEALWKKLQQSYLLAVVGASGSGKSSFVNAGLLPAQPDGWDHLQIKPGPAPFAALGRGLLGALGEADAIGNLTTLEDPQVAFDALCAWRALHPEVLLIVDQFEELFTQTDAAIQTAFAGLLSRAALDADVHVLVSMRDDFLLRCHDHDRLAPLFSELTPLKPPMGSALRRALTQPALKCGYRFEDEGMVEEMLAEVTKERGALPLIAFTAARLWEERDPEEGFLTRVAYDEMGGVGGALAQHAEATLDKIGRDRAPIVRELFRNLVTAQGTRAVMEVDEVLSVFDDDAAQAAEVLQALIDARLLTSYEVAVAEGEPQRRVEVVHESLLSAWPRLVRWRTQDAESAQLRDELRQAARLWDARDRSADLLWTGTTFREFLLWRERYPGRLTAVEESFAAAMIELAERARRRKRNVLAAVMIVLLGVVAGMTTLWRQSEVARKVAEAQKLIAIGQLEIDTFSTETLAWATRSLELADSEQARELVLKALWKGPPVFRIDQRAGFAAAFSPSGRYLASPAHFAPEGEPRLTLIEPDGTKSLLDQDQLGGSAPADWVTDEILMTLNYQAGDGMSEAFIWSVSERRVLGQARFEAKWYWYTWNLELEAIVGVHWNRDVFAASTTSESAPRVLGNLGRLPENTFGLSRDGTWVARVTEGGVEVLSVTANGLSEGRTVGSHAGATSLAAMGSSERIATRDDTGEIRIWDALSGSLVGSSQGPPGPGRVVRFDRTGSMLWLGVANEEGELDTWVLHVDEMLLRNLGTHVISDEFIAFDPVGMQVALPTRPGTLKWGRLFAPDGTEAIGLQMGNVREIHMTTIDPSGNWVVSPMSGIHAWSLARPYPFEGGLPMNRPVFHPSGESISGTTGRRQDVQVVNWGVSSLVSSNDGKRLLGAEYRYRPGPILISVEDGAQVVLPDGFEDQTSGIAFSPDDRYAVAAGGQFVPEENVAKVWDLETLELVASFDPVDPEEKLAHLAVGFTADNEVLVGTAEALYRWNFETDETTMLLEGRVRLLKASADGRKALVGFNNDIPGVRISMVDPVTGVETPLTSHGQVRAFALSRNGDIVASRSDEGVIRVGRSDNSEPHLMFSSGQGHVEIDPLGRWILSNGTFWPMPDLDQPPLHTLPLEELIAKLHSLTNFRIVPDPESPTGWKLDAVAFPGWETAPTW